MQRYLVKACYKTDGIRGGVKEGGRGRSEDIEKVAANMGGSVEAFYFAFGDDDAYIITELPDNVSAAAVALAVNSAGAAHAKTVTLLTPEEIDQATKKSVDYRPPGA